MRRLTRLLLFLAVLFCYALPVSAEDTQKTFNTRYALVYYSEGKDMADFIWRLGGQRIEFPADKSLASNRIDRIVDRVEAILDMRPKDFRINIYLHRGMLELKRIAFYEYRTKAIHISVDYASDGVFAHEIAHAIINHHFASPLPSKMQEILTQYVDKYLWNDY